MTMGDFVPIVECPQCGQEYDARRVDTTIMNDEHHFWCLNDDCTDRPFPTNPNLRGDVTVRLEETA